MKSASPTEDLLFLVFLPRLSPSEEEELLLSGSYHMNSLNLLKFVLTRPKKLETT